MKLAVVSAGILPLPAVRGGGVERNYIENMLNENERRANPAEITVFSIFDAKALEKSKTYKHSKFVYIDGASLCFKISKAVRYFGNRIFGNGAFGNAFISAVIAKFCLYDFDAVLIENKPEFAIPLRKIFKGKIANHLHNDYLGVDNELNRRVVESSDVIIAISKFILGRIRHEGKGAVLYTGVDLEQYDRKKFECFSDEIRAKYSIPLDDTLILYAGRLNPNKGIKELVRAFCMLPRGNSKLVVIGSKFFGKTQKDAFLAELEAAAQPRKDDIIFTGYIEQDALLKLYSTADISCVPSLWDEPAGYTVVEAMAFSVPLVVTRSGGIPELCDESCALILDRDGMLVNNLKSSIEKLSSDGQLRARMASAGRDRAEAMLSNEVCYNNLMSILS